MNPALPTSHLARARYRQVRARQAAQGSPPAECCPDGQLGKKTAADAGPALSQVDVASSAGPLTYIKATDTKGVLRPGAEYDDGVRI